MCIRDSFKARLADYPPARVAEITSLPETTIIALAQRYARVRPGMIKIADGINRHRNGGQTAGRTCALPALHRPAAAAGQQRGRPLAPPPRGAQ